MENIYIILAALVAYLIGSIPTAIWIGKIFYGIDVREYGSGNAGTTNTFRVLGKKAGIPVFLIDVLKAFFPAKFVVFFPYLIPGTADYVNLQLLFGAIAVLGHIFPVYAKFRGGKGVVSLLGVAFAVVPEAALVAFIVFLCTLVLTQYVSLSSLMAGFSFPIMIILVGKTTIVSLMFFSVILSVLLVLTHKKNIERLLKREENKAYIFKRKNKDNN
ncbi:MAG: glycerol-3-phosphate 1-O-acyltransferase PlsY [Bacteroidales bacterium]|jgi:glycerol-3-phosphate acyltransferase PlsY|nr:glycerol-3-phosphate 1-O-acyltransferase PlsY [Bacteroidales bacterium]